MTRDATLGIPNQKRANLSPLRDAGLLPILGLNAVYLPLNFIKKIFQFLLRR